MAAAAPARAGRATPRAPRAHPGSVCACRLAPAAPLTPARPARPQQLHAGGRQPAGRVACRAAGRGPGGLDDGEEDEWPWPNAEIGDFQRRKGWFRKGGKRAAGGRKPPPPPSAGPPRDPDLATVDDLDAASDALEASLDDLPGPEALRRGPAADEAQRLLDEAAALAQERLDQEAAALEAEAAAPVTIDNSELASFLRNIDSHLAAAHEREQDPLWMYNGDRAPDDGPADDDDGGDSHVKVWMEGESESLGDLIDWWSSLSVLYVLLFHIDQDGEEEEEGIFSCHDEDEDGSPLSFIIAFEEADEAECYAEYIGQIMEGWEAEIDALTPKELTDVCLDLNAGLRLVARGQDPPLIHDDDLTGAIQDEIKKLELQNMREQLEKLIPLDGQGSEEAATEAVEEQGGAEDAPEDGADA